AGAPAHHSQTRSRSLHRDPFVATDRYHPVDRHPARSRPAPLRRFRPLPSATAVAAIGTVWLLFTSWRRATIDTHAPGACVSATIWRFSASEYCRRFVAPACLVSTKLLVDTCSASSAIRRSLRQSALSGRRPSPSAYDTSASSNYALRIRSW